MRLQHDAQDLPRPDRTEAGCTYLRPETAQGIFVNFKNVMTTARQKPPFGIAQVGKSFLQRDHPGNFIFRTREFEQMEMEFFVKPGDDEQWHRVLDRPASQLVRRTRYRSPRICGYSNIRRKSCHHYAKGPSTSSTSSVFAGNPVGELEGLHNRTDFDLSTHSEHSGEDPSFFDQASGDRYTPYVIEPAAGLTRSLMAFLCDALGRRAQRQGRHRHRTVLKLDRRLAPIKAASPAISRNEKLAQGP